MNSSFVDKIALNWRTRTPHAHPPPCFGIPQNIHLILFCTLKIRTFRTGYNCYQHLQAHHDAGTWFVFSTIARRNSASLMILIPSFIISGAFLQSNRILSKFRGMRLSAHVISSSGCTLDASSSLEDLLLHVKSMSAVNQRAISAVVSGVGLFILRCSYQIVVALVLCEKTPVFENSRSICWISLWHWGCTALKSVNSKFLASWTVHGFAISSLFPWCNHFLSGQLHQKTQHFTFYLIEEDYNHYR